MMGDFAILFWIGCGVLAHVIQCSQMKTWCGTPIWREPTTWLMFFPAMLAGPIMFVFVKDNPSR